ncbi:MAG: glutamate--tRNA ligase [Parachlamydiales bacterium]
MSVRVRIAPSPTGDPHVGTAYIALFNQIFARHHGGSFILRIEDTDQKRSAPQYEQNIFEALKWAGIQWNEGPDIGGDFGPYRQSERLGIYQRYAHQLVDEGKAYKCFTTPEELAEMREVAAKLGQRPGYDRRHRNLSAEEIKEREGEGQPYVIRLKVPLTGECVYDDAIKGRSVVPWSDIDDQVLLKADGFPTYHLAAVVDDHLMEITHIIRGDEWMSSTPKHVLLYDSFGWTPPIFMHMPLLLGTDGKKLSKRRNPTSIFYYRDCGYLPEALTNFLTLMGYSMPGDQEIYTLEEITATFDAKRIGKSGAVFDVQKLDWLNQQYIISKIPESSLWERIRAWGFSDPLMERLMPLVHTRIKTFGEFMELCSFLFVAQVHPTSEELCPKGLTPSQSALILQAMIWWMERHENWGASGIEQASRDVAKLFNANHKKAVMAILYPALTGKKQGPPLFASTELLGKERTRARLLAAMTQLGGLSKRQLSELEKGWDSGDASHLMVPVHEGESSR